MNIEASFPVQSERSIEDIQKLYLAKGVGLQYETIQTPDSVNGRVAEIANISTEQEDRILRYFSKTEKEFNLSVKDNTIICLWSEIPEGPLLPVPEPEDLSMYIQKSKTLFEEISIDFHPAFLDFYKIGDILVARVYQEVKHRIPEIESSIYLYFHKDEIVGLRLEKCLKLSSELGGSYDIISVADALYKALEAANAGDILTEVRIVYKLNDDSLLATDLVRGEMFPYYELKFKDASAIYVRATR